ncbi:hypothetical protein HWV62_33085 [Athelia sp. TMB]|nr:hypothetical protein HWV62_33085 [Athelia sp. TMB]
MDTASPRRTYTRAQDLGFDYMLSFASGSVGGVRLGRRPDYAKLQGKTAEKKAEGHCRSFAPNCVASPSMPRHSCSITLQLEHDSDYQFLNALRMASGYPAYHPAHISLISRLKVFSSLDPARSELAALVRELQLVAKRARPFRIGYLRMDPHTPFGKGAGCVALTVENTPDLNSLVAVLESR